LSLKAFEGSYKVIIIWMAEYMHPSAANGLLKVFEEPSQNTVFILVSGDTEKLLGTILSRMQLVAIRGFNQREIEKQLLSTGVPGKKAALIGRLCGGNLKLAFRMASEAGEDQAGSTKEWLRLCYGRDLVELVRWSDEFHRMNKISQRGFLRFGLSLLHDTLLTHYGDTAIIMLPEEEKQFVRRFSQVVTPEKIEPLTRLITDALFHLERNASPKMVFLDLSLKISEHLKVNQVGNHH
jgi:DNA polymerase-3 subunit delta'